MTAPDQAGAEIRSALMAAVRVPDFVFLPAGAAPAVITALEAHAAATGKQVMKAPAPSRVQLAAAEYAQLDIPTISAGDDRAFLKNLSKIARGDVRVRPDD